MSDFTVPDTSIGGHLLHFCFNFLELPLQAPMEQTCLLAVLYFLSFKSADILMQIGKLLPEVVTALPNSDGLLLASAT